MSRDDTVKLISVIHYKKYINFEDLLTCIVMILSIFSIYQPQECSWQQLCMAKAGIYQKM